jgi:replicative DNA helicase
MFAHLKYTDIPRHTASNDLCDKFKDNFFYAKKGDFIIIGSKPFYGKSTFLYDLIARSLQKKRVSLLIDFSINKNVSASRLISRYAEVDYDLVFSDKLMSQDIEKYKKAQKDIINQENLLIPDIIDYSIINKLDDKIYEYNIKHKEKIEYVFLDFLQLFESDNQSYRYGDVSSMSRKLKHIAIKHNLVVVATSTFNRKYEDREDKTPKITDLRDSGAIEDCADYILLLDGYSNNKLSTDKKLYVHSNHSNVAKILKYKFFHKTKIFI